MVIVALLEEILTFIFSVSSNILLEHCDALLKPFAEILDCLENLKEFMVLFLLAFK